MSEYSVRREELENILGEKLRLKSCLSIGLYSIYRDGFGVSFSLDNEYKFANIVFDQENDTVKLLANSYNDFNFDNFKDKESIDRRNMRAIFFISELVLNHESISKVVREFIKSDEYVKFIEDFRGYLM